MILLLRHYFRQTFAGQSGDQICSDSIKIEPIKLKEFDVKQSKYDVAPKIPFRSVILGPSGSGKTIITEYDIKYL